MYMLVFDSILRTLFLKIPHTIRTFGACWKVLCKWEANFVENCVLHLALSGCQ